MPQPERCPNCNEECHSQKSPAHYPAPQMRSKCVCTVHWVRSVCVRTCDQYVLTAAIPEIVTNATTRTMSRNSNECHHQNDVQSAGEQETNPQIPHADRVPALVKNLKHYYVVISVSVSNDRDTRCLRQGTPWSSRTPGIPVWSLCMWPFLPTENHCSPSDKKQQRLLSRHTLPLRCATVGLSLHKALQRFLSIFQRAKISNRPKLPAGRHNASIRTQGKSQ